MIEQKKVFVSGNEAIALAAKHIHFHFMGYYPITPSTEIAHHLDKWKANGEIQTVMLPADGEHGAAGACFGASTTGARVLNATSANGFLYSLEQLPVQAGSRRPMVLNLVTRSVSGPLDIRCDHSDLAYALQTGWLILLASTPQAAYDLNIIAVKLGEHAKVRLPVMVVTDGFFTSHQSQELEIFKDSQIVQDFLGPIQQLHTSVNPRVPVTIGPYMNDPDLINNKLQLHHAHEEAITAFNEVTEEYYKLSGRRYDFVEAYQAEDAEIVFVILNSAAETIKDVVDEARKIGLKVGLLKPQVLRPFPEKQLAALLRNRKAVIICERNDTPGSQGGTLVHEVKSVLFDEKIQTHCLTRVFGLGGKEFTTKDGHELLQQAVDSLSGKPHASFSFFGDIKGDAQKQPPQVLPPLSIDELSESLVAVEELATPNGKEFLNVKVSDLSQMVRRPKRIAAGHGACPGCGIFSGLDQFFKGISGDVVVLYHTGCAMVVTTDYPFSAHRITYLHNLFQNGAPTLAGVQEAYFELRRRGELSSSNDITFVMITGDGGMDIGLGPTLGTAVRNHPLIVLEYDNQGYMNTGGQLSYSTPAGHQTVTSHSGKFSSGKMFHHRNTPELMAATGIPYVFTAIESLNTDLIVKAAKAQWYARHHGLVYGKLLTACPLNWGSEERQGQNILQKAVDCCFYPLYEVERGLTKLNYNPEAGVESQKIPVSQWLQMMQKTKHLLDSKNKDVLDGIQAEVDRRWNKLKARAQHELL
ncbi:MAG: thiamine pyrophosphate-dependent enzyme [Bdellovibrionia bacterium]